jgi:hypothetical protein
MRPIKRVRQSHASCRFQDRNLQMSLNRPISKPGFSASGGLTEMLQNISCPHFPFRVSDSELASGYWE